MCTDRSPVCFFGPEFHRNFFNCIFASPFFYRRILIFIKSTKFNSACMHDIQSTTTKKNIANTINTYTNYRAIYYTFFILVFFLVLFKSHSSCNGTQIGGFQYKTNKNTIFIHSFIHFLLENKPFI